MKRNNLTKYKEFNKYITSPIITIPKLNSKIDTDYIPQGICHTSSHILITAYDNFKKNNSIIYILDNKGNHLNNILLDGKYHCGGITYNKNTENIYITGSSGQEEGKSSYINKYNLKNILDPKNKTIKPISKIKIDNNNTLKSSITKKSSVAFLTTHQNKIYLGNFTQYKKGLIKIYNLNDSGEIISKTEKIITNPYKKTQGLCIYNYKNKDYFFFSTSYGKNNNSHIFISILDKNNKFKTIKKIKLPPLLEQINIYNNKLIIIFESSSNKYKTTCKISINKIYFLDIETILNN